MILCDLSEVIDNSFYHHFMCQTFLTNVDGHCKMNKLQGGMNRRMLPITDIGKALLAGIVASIAAMNN